MESSHVFSLIHPIKMYIKSRFMQDMWFSKYQQHVEAKLDDLDKKRASSIKRGLTGHFWHIWSRALKGGDT